MKKGEKERKIERRERVREVKTMMLTIVNDSHRKGQALEW